MKLSKQGWLWDVTYESPSSTYGILIEKKGQSYDKKKSRMFLAWAASVNLIGADWFDDFMTCFDVFLSWQYKTNRCSIVWVPKYEFRIERRVVFKEGQWSLCFTRSLFFWIVFRFYFKKKRKVEDEHKKYTTIEVGVTVCSKYDVWLI